MKKILKKCPVCGRGYESETGKTLPPVLNNLEVCERCYSQITRLSEPTAQEVAKTSRIYRVEVSRSKEEYTHLLVAAKDVESAKAMSMDYADNYEDRLDWEVLESDFESEYAEDVTDDPEAIDDMEVLTQVSDRFKFVTISLDPEEADEE